MALIESLGYKQDSTPQRRKRQSLLSDFSMTPYGAQMGKSQGAAASQENSHLLSNRPAARARSREAGGKYGALPTKSLRSSGIGAISPLPNRLELTQHDCAMPISPIKASEALQQSQASNFVDASQLNTTTNTLNFSQLPRRRKQLGQVGQAGQVSQAQQVVAHETQVTIIGFPPGEAAFIHRRFGSYGSILNSEWSDNALFLEYERKQHAQRALAENAKWITNGNERYMIAVTHAELTELNGQTLGTRRRDEARGRFLSLDSLDSLGSASHLGRRHANVEKAPAIQFGPTHILWKVFDFVTSGW